MYDGKYFLRILYSVLSAILIFRRKPILTVCIVNFDRFKSIHGPYCSILQISIKGKTDHLANFY